MRGVAIIFHGRFPSEKAAALWVAQVAEKFGTNGFQTTLIVPHRRGNGGDPLTQRRLAHEFSVRAIFTLDLFHVPILRRFAFAVSAFTFSLSALLYLMRHAPRDIILYSNDPQALWLLSFFFRNCFYELHVVPTDKLFLYRGLFRRMRGFIAITKWGAGELTRQFGISRERIIHAPGGVDIKKFEIRDSKLEAREKLGLPIDKKLALYTGHLYEWKGVDTLARAAKLLPDVEVIFVGGTMDDVASLKEKYGEIANIRIVEQRPHAEIPLWQRSADVLVLPNTARKRISKYNTSPMKLFEYMASGTPIVASDLPSVREVLSEQSAILVTPDNPRVLAMGIQQSLAEAAGARALRAREVVAEYAWEKRGARIAAFVRTIIS